MILPAQIRAARSLLGLSQSKLSQIAGVGISTVKRIELSPGVTGSARTLLKIQTALENAGIEFIAAESGKGPGVRLSQEGGAP
jgi:transcriptional regulator with XRE-family HTH domain